MVFAVSTLSSPVAKTWCQKSDTFSWSARGEFTMRYSQFICACSAAVMYSVIGR